MLLAILVVLALAPARAHAHPHDFPPTVWLNIDVRADEVFVKVIGRVDWLPRWLGFAGVSGAVRRGLPAPDAVAEAAKRFSRDTPVEIDGVAATPVGKKLKLRLMSPLDAGMEHFEFHCAYPLSAPAKSFKLRWTNFDGADWGDEVVVPTVIEVDGYPTSHSFMPDEPELTWHATKRTPRFAGVVDPVAAPPAVRWSIPVVALACLLATLLWVVLAWRAGWRFTVAGIAVGAVLSIALGGVGVVVVTSPFADAIEMPPKDQARLILESLLNNVYRAFDERGESAVYDRLARCAHESMLDRLYADVHESLILREDGGAVATVQEVTFGDLAVQIPEPGEPDSARLRFHVEGSWQVRCSITHFGHTHTRWNKYKARFAVQHDGQSWKIAEMNVIDYHREDDGKPGDRKLEQPAKD